MVASKRQVVLLLSLLISIVVVLITFNSNFDRKTYSSSYKMETGQNQTMSYVFWTSSQRVTEAVGSAVHTDTAATVTTSLPKVVAAVPEGTTMPQAPAALNPGCTTRNISKYMPLDMGLEYHHPSLIQYAKLAPDPNTIVVELTFTEYMALLSAYKFLKPDKIMIHTYTDIAGTFWDIINKWDTIIELNRVERVTILGSQVMPTDHITHQADFVKVRGLYEFGGIISDFDVIIINGTALKAMQAKAECVLSLETNFINAGFNSCIKNSAFVLDWLNGYYTDYQPDSWLYNASYRPKYILEAVDGACYNMHVVGNIAMNPKWNEYEKWLQKDGVQWREKIAAHYFDKSLKGRNQTALQVNNSFGEMLRYVYDA